MMVIRKHARQERLEAQILAWLEDVADPEIPVLSVVDLGIVRGVHAGADGIEIEVTPTYSGCPATDVIEQSIVDALEERGLNSIRVRRCLSPPWTTDWISAAGRAKLAAYGIAPPDRSADKRSLSGDAPRVSCPRCASGNTALVSQFGSTPCKAAYRCASCLEPFEYFKCL
ncbi:MAG: phenylacetate-CoA oxygenase subunit PaaJ [Gammaproteobacteria bacterium]|nr:phenylacetate-CoA oxygenase subunit PaaJ [Gammaproteobacteria bacterium]MDH4253444.1 phenylacetate-CoA oxygenase subunit PaaJ [Gammaproteobacteria bacterium]MDH5309194.1 phenylacetate-CoA oxygenase subunit PaaJ [Gammaproteobacteria bacterium]